MQKFEHDVFISYSHKDVAWVEQVLLPRLQKEYINYYYDDKFTPGVPSIINMEDAVEKSRKIILVLTPDWVESDWSGFEAMLAQSADPLGKQRRLIPVMLRSCQLPPRLSRLTYINLAQMRPGTPDFEAQMQRLIGTIRLPVPLQPPRIALPPQQGELNVPLPLLPVARPDWEGGLKIELKDDTYLLVSTREEPIEKYEAEDKGSIIWQARAMQLNKQHRPAWLKQVVKRHDSRSVESNFQALRAEYSLLYRLSLTPYPQKIDIYEQEDALTLAYEYPPGKTLARQYPLSDRPLDVHYIKPFLRSLLPLFDTLKILHDEKRAHRNLSPATILLLSQRPGIAVLRDLGLAAFPAHRKEGPEGYQAPEQMNWGGTTRFSMPGPETDVYQLAAIIYRILTGLPVSSSGHILPPRVANEQIPVALDEVLLQALNPDTPKLRPSVKKFSYEIKRSMNQM